MFSFLDKNPKDIVLYYIVELTSSNNKSDSLEVSTKKKKTTITLLRVIPTMTCRVVVVRWGLSGCFVSPIFPTRDKEPCRNPSHLFSRLLRALVVFCPPFSVAPGTSVCESKAQTCRRRNMPNHVRTPPGKHISINRHQTCQYTS